MTPAIPLSDTERSGTSTSVDLLLLQLPREIILLILHCLPEPELLKLCEVSSDLQQLALLTLLARHGVSETQVQAQELSKVRSRAIRSLCACYPTLIPNILVHLAERFPLIPDVTFTFSDRSSASERFTGLWNLLPTTLVSLMGNHSRPVVILHYLDVTAVRPKVPNLLKRTLKAPKRPSAAAVPVVDKMKLTRKLLSTIATATTRRLLSSISLRSFTEPSAPLGALMILNCREIFYLNIGEHIFSRREWEFLMPELHLPSLRALFIRIDFELAPLSAFLEEHKKIEHLEFVRDWSCLRDRTLPPFSISALPRLKHILASARVVACILHTPNDFPLLEYVGIGSQEPSADNPDSAAYFQEALGALAARTSVTTLVLHLQNIELPWANFDTKERAEKELRSVEKLELLEWTREVEHDTFPAWLAMFPGLHDLSISGNFFQPTKGPLVSDSLMEAINATCPHIVVKQERRLALEKPWPVK
ncbi:hypothetical protein B0H14DRAFT_2938354 [Mycena olivaceomarginata]|nr:hypothetical protein B0H14DRAFT_2938354 [Mycena olivaceomarginata]